MSNFRPLPHPSQASSNSLVYLSIWPKPRSQAIGLIQPWSRSQVSALLNLSWEGRSTVVGKTSRFKGWTSGTGGRREKAPHKGTFGPRRLRHTGCLFPVSISAGRIDPQPCAA